ncbi:Conserved_hypothetical protein [Hexamita inflata]|uniref:Condensation domain-containing protein n=1 Tax=Hexamita inflata TaxID=28002 RepID=A0AA86PR07_9EUKA|nr:Conserved hypothetical protein [Hexamita inflata]
MFQVVNLFDHQKQDETVFPPFSASDIKLDDPNRFLTTYEVKQSTRNMTNCDLGLIEGELCLDRANKVINHLMQLYPFFSYGLRYDQEAKWMRYVQQPVLEVNLQVSTTLNSLQDIGDFIAAASHSLNSQKLSHWEVVNVHIPEMPTVKQALSIKTYHVLIDGVSVMQLLKKFNQLYSNADFSFDKPEPVQVSNYRPAMSYQGELDGLAPLKPGLQTFSLTKITGQFDGPSGSSIKFMDEFKLRCRCYNEAEMARIPNVQYSFSLYAIQMAHFAGYAYFNKDLQKDQKFIGAAVDLRREKFVQNIDFENILGQSATTAGMMVSGTIHTTLQEIADQLQSQFANTELTAQKFWQKTLGNEVGPIQFKKGPEVSILCSNIGKQNLDVGPIVQMIGYSSHTHVWDTPSTLFSNSMYRGKMGMFALEWDVGIFNEEQQTQCSQIYVELNKLIKMKGADSVTIEDACQLYTQYFTSTKVHAKTPTTSQLE